MAKSRIQNKSRKHGGFIPPSVSKTLKSKSKSNLKSKSRSTTNKNKSVKKTSEKK